MTAGVEVRFVENGEEKIQRYIQKDGVLILGGVNTESCFLKMPNLLSTSPQKTVIIDNGVGTEMSYGDFLHRKLGCGVEITIIHGVRGLDELISRCEMIRDPKRRNETLKINSEELTGHISRRKSK